MERAKLVAEVNRILIKRWRRFYSRRRLIFPFQFARCKIDGVEMFVQRADVNGVFYNGRC